MVSMHDFHFMARRRGPVVLALLALVVACSATSAQQTRKQGPNDVVATVGSVSITLAEVDDKALRLPADTFGKTQLWQALYEARHAALDDLVANTLLEQDAKSRGVERSKLIEEEIGAKVAQPTDAEIEEWYEANPERVQGVPLDRVR